MQDRSRRRAGRGREADRPGRLFLVATLLVAVLYLPCVELALRIFGFGGSYPLFIEVPGQPGYLQANPEVMRRYLMGTVDPAATIDPILFRDEKLPKAYRIVVQGGSTAAGYPYSRWAGLAGMLGDRLEAAFPEKPIEVITTATAAVNTYTLLDLVDEIIEIQPDAVLIYAGHNEYLGVLGVGSGLTAERSRRAIRLHLGLRRLRVYQTMRGMIAFARHRLASATGSEGGSLFARAAAGSLIRFGSRAFAQGVSQLRANLSEILEKYQTAGIPVYLGTLVSNEKDQPPFVGGPRQGVDRLAWERTWQAYRAHAEAQDLNAARSSLSRLLEIDDAADAWYALAQLELRAGRPDAAREAYRKAKDRDQLRFRAPEIFNGVIRGLAERYGATLVDVQQAFLDASPLGITGRELFHEHVHPNAEGYFLMSDAYCQALERDARIGDWSRAPSRREASRDMPITEVDRIVADYSIDEIKSGFPFREPEIPFLLPEPRNEIERLAQRYYRDEVSWLEMMESLLQLHLAEGRTREAAVVARIAAQAFPTNPAPNLAAGQLLLELRQPARARRYLERARRAERPAIPARPEP